MFIYTCNKYASVVCTIILDAVLVVMFLNNPRAMTTSTGDVYEDQCGAKDLKAPGIIGMIFTT